LVSSVTSIDSENFHCVYPLNFGFR
jgi:hypothetical protein